jgi:3'(2'), 5'-bisphosphate nucleotidase
VDLANWIEPGIRLAKTTGQLLIEYWHHPERLECVKKSDGSPCTTADLAAHDALLKGLAVFSPQIPIISEEGVCPDYQIRSAWRSYWLLDPLDGTHGFLNHLDLFSINIALVLDHRAVIGIIHVPIPNLTYYAWLGGGAFVQQENDKPRILKTEHKSEAAPWKVVMGQYSKGATLIKRIQQKLPFQILQANGAVKFGWLANNQADIYPRLGLISEWDTAAGQCILEEAGGIVVDLKGQPLQYNRQDSLLNPEFIALADPAYQQIWLNMLGENV